MPTLPRLGFTHRIAILMTGWLLTTPALCAGPAKDRIVFQGGTPARFELFISDADGNGERPLLAASTAAYNPSFSADGNWIMFTGEQNGSADIYRVHPDGSGIERLTDSPSFDDQGVLSPDGSTLAFVSTRQGGLANIWLLNIARHQYVRLTDSPGGNFRPSWAPDGRWIAFSSGRDAPHQRYDPDQPPPAGSGCCGWELKQLTAVYVVHPDGSGLRRLTKPDRTAGSPKWSADGHRLVYYSDDTTPDASVSRANGPVMQIVSMDIASGKSEVLTTGPDIKWSPQFLSDSKVAYLTGANDKRLLADTTGWKGSPGSTVFPSWSPDGKLVVYTKAAREHPSESTPLVKVPSIDREFELDIANHSLAYSPDGRSVLVSGSFVGEMQLLVMDADGSNQHVLFDAKARNAGIVSPTWSPDGHYIAFTLGRFGLRNPNTSAQLAVVNSDGSGFRVLTDGPNNSGYPSFSPDGKQLVYRVLGAEEGLRILSLPDGKVRRLTDSHDNFPAWSPRGDQIEFTSFRTGNFEIYTIKSDGTDLRQLTHDSGNDAHAVWSPDGQSLLFTTSRTGWKDESALFPDAQSYGEIAVMRSDGSHLRQLTDNQWEDAAVIWLPPAHH